MSGAAPGPAGPALARARRARFVTGAVASGVLCALSARTEAPWQGFAFVVLVPWLLALRLAASYAEALAAGLAMALALCVAAFPWLPDALALYSQSPSTALPWLLLVAAAPLLEPQFVAYALARHALARRPGPRAALVAAAAYVGFELLVGKPLADTLGQLLYPSRHLRQGADLAGVHGLTVALLLANEAVAAGLARWALLRAASGGGGSGIGDGVGGTGVVGGTGGLAALPKALRRAFVLGPFAVAAAIMASLWAYGYVRAAGLAPDAAGSAAAGAPPLRVGVVQASVTNYEKLRAEKGAFETVRSILDDHFALSDSLRRGAEPDFVVWPETVYPMTFGSPKSDAGAAFDADVLAFAAERKLPLVFGAYDRDGGGEGGREYNAAYFLSAPREGRPPAIATYRKGNLFPFTERVPRLVDSPWLREALPWVGGWHEGPGPTVVPLVLRDGRALSVAPLICYDVVFSNFVAEAARQGADLLVTLSNDSWFPDERAPKLHLVAAAFRSVETRLPQVRATNSGISALIAPTGDILDGADWNQRRAFAGTLPPAPGGLTLAVRIAPYRGPALLGAAFVALAFELRRRRAAARAPSAPRAPSPARGSAKPSSSSAPFAARRATEPASPGTANAPTRPASAPGPADTSAASAAGGPADAGELAPASGPADDAEPASTAGPTDDAAPAPAARPARPAKGGARRKKRR